MNRDFDSKILLGSQSPVQMNYFVPNQTASIADSLTGNFFEELYGVINESENFLSTSAKEIAELQSDYSMITSMQQEISKQAKSLVNFNSGLKEELALKRSLLKKNNFTKKSERM